MSGRNLPSTLAVLAGTTRRQAAAAFDAYLSGLDGLSGARFDVLFGEEGEVAVVPVGGRMRDEATAALLRTASVRGDVLEVGGQAFRISRALGSLGVVEAAVVLGDDVEWPPPQWRRRILVAVRTERDLGRLMQAWLGADYDQFRVTVVEPTGGADEQADPLDGMRGLVLADGPPLYAILEVLDVYRGKVWRELAADRRVAGQGIFVPWTRELPGVSRLGLLSPRPVVVDAEGRSAVLPIETFRPVREVADPYLDVEYIAPLRPVGRTMRFPIEVRLVVLDTRRRAPSPAALWYLPPQVARRLGALLSIPEADLGPFRAAAVVVDDESNPGIVIWNPALDAPAAMPWDGLDGVEAYWPFEGVDESLFVPCSAVFRPALEPETLRKLLGLTEDVLTIVRAPGGGGPGAKLGVWQVPQARFASLRDAWVDYVLSAHRRQLEAVAARADFDFPPVRAARAPAAAPPDGQVGGGTGAAPEYGGARGARAQHGPRGLGARGAAGATGRERAELARHDAIGADALRDSVDAHVPGGDDDHGEAFATGAPADSGNDRSEGLAGAIIRAVDAILDAPARAGAGGWLELATLLAPTRSVEDVAPCLAWALLDGRGQGVAPQAPFEALAEAPHVAVLLRTAALGRVAPGERSNVYAAVRAVLREGARAPVLVLAGRVARQLLHDNVLAREALAPIDAILGVGRGTRALLPHVVWARLRQRIAGALRPGLDTVADAAKLGPVGRAWLSGLYVALSQFQMARSYRDAHIVEAARRQLVEARSNMDPAIPRGRPTLAGFLDWFSRVSECNAAHPQPCPWDTHVPDDPSDGTRVVVHWAQARDPDDGLMLPPELTEALDALCGDAPPAPEVVDEVRARVRRLVEARPLDEHSPAGLLHRTVELAADMASGVAQDPAARVAALSDAIVRHCFLGDEAVMLSHLLRVAAIVPLRRRGDAVAAVADALARRGLAGADDAPTVETVCLLWTLAEAMLGYVERDERAVRLVAWAVDTLRNAVAQMWAEDPGRGAD